MHGDILLAIPIRLVGVPPSPGPDIFMSGRTRLTAWLLSLPSVAPSCTSAQEDYTLLGFWWIPQRAVKNQKVHLVRIAVFLFFQIAVKVKIPKSKTAEVFIKQADFFRIKMDSADTKTPTNLLRQNLIQTIGAEERSGLVYVQLFSTMKSWT